MAKWLMEQADIDNASPEDLLRMRLVQIDDELRALPSDAFAEKHELNLETDEIRNALSELEGDQSEALKEWTERASRKGTPASQDETWASAIVQAKGNIGAGGA